MRLALLKRFCSFIVICGILTMGLLLYMLYNTAGSLRAWDSQRLDAFSLIEELRNSSRKLTQFARSVVVTVDPEAEKAYQRIMDVRAGVEPRPKSAYVAPDRPVDFMTLLGEAGLSDAEYTPLRLAYEASQALARVEQEAMRLSRDLNLDEVMTSEQRARAQEAVRKVFGPAYVRTQEAIQGHLDNGVANVLSRMGAQQDDLTQRMSLLLLGLCGTLFLLVVSLVYLGHLRWAVGRSGKNNLHLYFYALFALVLALGVPMWLFYTDARTILVSAVEKRQALICREVYREIHMRATQALEMAQIVASRPPLRQYVAQENKGRRLDPEARAAGLEVLHSFVDRYTDTAQCVLLGKDGAVLGSTIPEAVQRRQYLFSPQEIQRVMRGESFITSVVMPGSNTPDLAVLTPVHAGDENMGESIGAVVSLLDKRNSFQLWEDRLASEERMNIFVMNDQAVVVLSSRGQERQGLQLQDDPVGRMVRDGVEGLRYYTDAYGVERIGYFWRLPQLGWTVGVTSVYASLTESVRDMLVRAALFGVMAILVAVAVFTQIMRRMTRNLEDSNEQLTSLMEQGGIHTWELDIVADVVRFDAQWLKNAGFPPPWEDGVWPVAKLMLHLHPDDRPLIADLLNVLEGERYVTFELRVRNPQGVYFWHKSIGRVTASDSSGRAVRYACMGYDVTALKRVEASEAALQSMTETLQETNERLTTLMDGAGIHTWSLDMVADTFTFSAQWIKNSGYPPPWEDGVWPAAEVQVLLHPDDIVYVKDQLAKAGLGAYLRFDMRVRSYSGEYQWHRSIARVDAVNEHGEVACISAMGFDITAQKKVEQSEAEYKQMLEGIVLQRTRELEESRNQAEAASQAKTAFLSTVSHEIRTPMNAIVGFAHIFDRSNLTPLQKEYLDKITLSSGTLLGIINDVLDISKIKAGKLELERIAFDLHHMLDNVLSIVGFAASEKGLSLTLDIGEDVPEHFMGDTKRLSQILLNLLNNALKFTPTGTVSLTVSVGQPVNPAEKARLISFSVRDTGIGMASEQLARLFQPFMQADSSVTRRFGGTGLGLAISRQLVELMGGSIGVSSEEGHGSNFHFALPLALATEEAVYALIAQATGQNSHGDALSLEGVHVLVVEDNDINQEIARALLEEYDIKVDVAHDGVHALKMVQEAQYQCIFMDMQMPIMGGLEATERIRALGREAQANDEPAAWLATVPIIAMTANAMSEDRQRCLAAGMDDHIGKPIDSALLRQCLLRWVGQYSKHVEPAPAVENSQGEAPQ